MTTVSIVSPNAPMKVNATIRCASVGFGRRGRCAVSAGAGGFLSVGGVVTVGRVVRLPFSRDHARRDHTLNALHGTLGRTLSTGPAIGIITL